ncbi:NADP-dependent oxidoreductase [Streptomyces paromomycinus]|uniref:NADPH:quinone reductase n=1 Tax=Streptomyces paromomycinus TaxID=92743 RepID=A0A401W4M9_STREY|nr:NADP-dependent oxidoreductase [Streptomyces paromomycinus]GCD44280.1 NADPH:quinone reductase [Streptomyces paromomycinus]
MSRAVRYRRFGGPEVLELQEIPEPHAAPDEVRVRVTAAGLNPMDWQITSRPDMAAGFGITLPAGFGSDFAGVVDEVGAEAAGFAVGDRVYGAAIGRSVADFVLIRPSAATLFPTPEGVGDEVAGTLPVSGLTACAALDAIGLRAGETVLIGGAAGGVGLFAVQLAKLAGARVLGTASEGTFGFLRGLGAEPVAYGPGLADRVRALAPEGITAAADLFGREAAEAALELGVAPERISVVADGPAPPPGVRKTGALAAGPGAMERIADAVRAGGITVPIAATYPVERIREAVATQAERHVHGKIVIAL